MIASNASFYFFFMVILQSSAHLAVDVAIVLRFNLHRLVVLPGLVIKIACVT